MGLFLYTYPAGADHLYKIDEPISRCSTSTMQSEDIASQSRRRRHTTKLCAKIHRSLEPVCTREWMIYAISLMTPIPLLFICIKNTLKTISQSNNLVVAVPRVRRRPPSINKTTLMKVVFRNGLKRPYSCSRPCQVRRGWIICKVYRRILHRIGL